jgi:hypothetical protein
LPDYLQLDNELSFRGSNRYGNFLMSEYAMRRGWRELRIDSVQTQVNYGGNIPDLVRYL